MLKQNSADSYNGDKPEGKITVAGSSSISPIMQKLIEAYKKVNPNAKIELQENDSTSGMTRTMDGTWVPSMVCNMNFIIN